MKELASTAAAAQNVWKFARCYSFTRDDGQSSTSTIFMNFFVVRLTIFVLSSTGHYYSISFLLLATFFHRINFNKMILLSSFLLLHE